MNECVCVYVCVDEFLYTNVCVYMCVRVRAYKSLFSLRESQGDVNIVRILMRHNFLGWGLLVLKDNILNPTTNLK